MRRESLLGRFFDGLFTDIDRVENA
jgi:hypothetical protein